MRQYSLIVLFSLLSIVTYSQQVSNSKNAIVKSTIVMEEEPKEIENTMNQNSNKKIQANTVEQKKTEEEPLPTSQPTVISSSRKQQ